MAFLYGLDFVPLRCVRFDLVLPSEFLEYPPLAQLLETLGHRQVRMQLRELGGYDTSRTGEVVART
jgi:putative molybdopterin biosynthesis protein